jgi:hypothetical protein
MQTQPQLELPRMKLIWRDWQLRTATVLAILQEPTRKLPRKPLGSLKLMPSMLHKCGHRKPPQLAELKPMRFNMLKVARLLAQLRKRKPMRRVLRRQRLSEKRTDGKTRQTWQEMRNWRQSQRQMQRSKRVLPRKLKLRERAWQSRMLLRPHVRGRRSPRTTKLPDWLPKTMLA